MSGGGGKAPSSRKRPPQGSARTPYERDEPQQKAVAPYRAIHYPADALRRPQAGDDTKMILGGPEDDGSPMEPPEDYKPAPISGIVWMDIDAKEEPSEHPEYCFWCFFDHDPENEFYRDLMTLHKKASFGSSPLVAAELVQAEYNKAIRPKLEILAMRALPWYKSSIAHHDTLHVVTARTVVAKDIQSLQQIKLVFENHELLTCDKRTGKKRLNLQALKAYLETLKMSKELLNLHGAMSGGVR